MVVLARRIRSVPGIDPDAPAIEYAGSWHSWRLLGALIDEIDGLLASAGLGPGSPVGLLLRNCPEHAGAAIALLVGERCLVTFTPLQADASLAAELRALRLPAVIAGASDWARDDVRQAVADVSSLGIRISRDAHPAAIAVPGLDVVGPGPRHPDVPGVALEMLTSGTTGAAKRVRLQYRHLEDAFVAADATGGRNDQPPRLASGVAIISAPLVHIGGMYHLINAVMDGRKLVLLDKFQVGQWVDAVRRHRPKVASLPPTGMRMVLDARVPKADLASLAAIRSGTAPLSRELWQEWDETYGIPVLVVYGATEFAGAVAGWTLQDHRRWGAAKRGSVGRFHRGIEGRVVDVETEATLALGQVGLLELRGAQIASGGGDWVRTTDLGRIDDDGFVWIEGRADDVIIRGGFKVAPAEVTAVLERHPAVREAAVIALPDQRLGQVPVAAVELNGANGARADSGDLSRWCREHLTPYQVPLRILVLDALPRTESMKVSRPGLAALFDEPAAPDVAPGGAPATGGVSP